MSSLRMVVLGSAVASASVIAGDFHNTTAPVVFTTEVVTAYTTYCPSPTTLTHGNKTYTVTAATTLTITDCPCTVSKPVQPTATPGDECIKNCLEAYNECRGKSGANMSTCGSELAACSGQNPFTDGHLPTACAKPTGTNSPPATNAPAAPTSSGLPPQPTGGKGCDSKCNDAFDECRGKPGANMSTCSSELGECIAENSKNGSSDTLPLCPAPTTATAPVVTGVKPPGNSTNPPVIAGAGTLAPAKLLLALGAIALL